MSEILDGVMFNKDVTHTGMKRRIENPRLMEHLNVYTLVVLTFNIAIILIQHSVLNIFHRTMIIFYHRICWL